MSEQGWMAGIGFGLGTGIGFGLVVTYLHFVDLLDWPFLAVLRMYWPLHLVSVLGLVFGFYCLVRRYSTNR